MLQTLSLVLLCYSLQVYTQSLHIIYVTHTGDDTEECWGAGNTHPCETLDYALEGAQQYDAVKIQLSIGNYTLQANESVTTIKNKTHFQLVGEVQNVSIQCMQMTGLSFYNSSNLLLQNIALRGCGALHNSSSHNSSAHSSKKMEYLPFLASLYFLLCDNVELYYIEVTDSLGTGVVFYSTGGQNIISFSNFTHNVAYNRPESYQAGGGGVAIEFLYCIPGDVNCSDKTASHIPVMNQKNASYLFTSCIFAKNNGSTGNYISDTYILPHSNNNVALGRGGGLAVIFKGSATGNVVTLQSCTFWQNMAIWGGGMLMEFQDSAVNNTVTVQESFFINNECMFNPCTYQGTGGGGVRILIASVNNTVQQNNVEFIKTYFTGNRAYFGGGVSFMTWDPIPRPGTSFDVQSNLIIFNTVNWTENVARLGSAIDLSILASNGSILQPIFQNCIFQDNTVEYTNKTGTPSGSGTLYSDSVPIRFIDNVQFINNTGSAIVSVEAVVEFDEPIVATFENNSGHVGGGIALYSKAYIMMHKNSHLQFQNNVANLHGGGIYWESIGNHDLVSSRNCFIRYEDTLSHPSEWKVTFDFNSNTAGLTGNAIYGTTLLGCLWGGKLAGNLDDPKSEFSNIFCWNSTNNNTQQTWNYGTSNCSESIATSPAYFAHVNFTRKCDVPYNKSVVPGNVTTLPFLMLDDRFAHVPNTSFVFSADINTTNHSVKYLAYDKVLVTGSVGEKVDYKVSTVHPRVISSHILLIFEDCPPGFKPQLETQKCIGAEYPFVLTHSNLTASIQRGCWIGSVNGALRVSQCAYCSFNPHLDQTNYITLPSKNEELESFFCDGLNRKGILCGQCKEGYGPAVNSDQYKCVKCSHEETRYSWILYILSEYLPNTLALLIVIIFNISVTSGPANSFVFFAQIISTTFGINAGGLIHYMSITPNAKVLKQIYNSIYGVWNLDFLLSFDWWLYCLGPNINTIQILALNYLTAAYPLLVLLIAAILISLYDRNNRVVVCVFRPFHRLFARCFGWLNLKRSITDAFATFLVLSYVKFTVTCAFLLYPKPLYNENGTVSHHVTYRDGTYKYNSPEYFPYLISSIAVLIIICILMPTVLFLYSIKPFYSFLERFCFTCLLPGQKTQHFFNAFHHCYKDGTDGGYDQRYFASLYFFLRLIIIFSYSYAKDWISHYIIQQVICTVALVMISTFQPYKKKLHNIIDTAIFGILATINVLTLYNLYLDNTNNDLSAPCFYIQIILIFLPLVYMTAYIIFYVCHANKKSLKACCLKMARKGGFKRHMDHPELDHFSFGDFMDGVNAEGRFEQNAYHGPIQTDELNRDVGDETPTPNAQLEHTSFQLPQIISIAPSSRRRELATEPILSRRVSLQERSTRFNSENYGSISGNQLKIN